MSSFFVYFFLLLYSANILFTRLPVPVFQPAVSIYGVIIRSTLHHFRLYWCPWCSTVWRNVSSSGIHLKANFCVRYKGGRCSSTIWPKLHVSEHQAWELLSLDVTRNMQMFKLISSRINLKIGPVSWTRQKSVGSSLYKFYNVFLLLGSYNNISTVYH